MTLSEATETYLSQADYLTDADLPMVTALRMLAEEIDTNGVTAALANTYGVTFRTLSKKAGENTGGYDPHQEFLDAL